MKTFVSIKNSNGASLLEVMIAMVILTVGFLGVMALSIALTNNNATAGKINTATTIAQAEVSQLNCLGVSGINNNLANWGIASLPGTYTYTVSPVVLNPDSRNSVTSCINPALASGGPAPYSPAPTGLGITLLYTVTINLAYNSISPSLINAKVQVTWYNAYNVGNAGNNIGEHMITLYDTI